MEAPQPLSASIPPSLQLLEVIPPEVLLMILSYLSASGLCAFALVSKRGRHLASASVLWETLTRASWSMFIPPPVIRAAAPRKTTDRCLTPLQPGERRDWKATYGRWQEWRRRRTLGRSVGEMTWVFTEEAFPRSSDTPEELAAFTVALDAQLQNDWCHRGHCIDLQEVVLRTPSFRLDTTYFYLFSPHTQTRPIVQSVEIVANDPRVGFRLAELMFKLHNVLLGYDLGNHIFFEGLQQEYEQHYDEATALSPPLWSISLGS